MSVGASIPTYRTIAVFSLQESGSTKMTFTVQDEGNTILPNVGDHLSKDTRWNILTHTQPQVPHDHRVDSVHSSHPSARIAPPVQLTDTMPSSSCTHILQSGRNIYTGNERPAVVFTSVMWNCCVLANYAVRIGIQDHLSRGNFRRHV